MMNAMRFSALSAVLVAFSLAYGDNVLLTQRDCVTILNRKSHAWTFPGVAPDKGRVVLEFRHRIDYPHPAGWCPCWQLEVNGRTITAAATRREPRLLNKPYEMRHKHFGSFIADNHSDKWYSLYLPDFKAADGAFVPPTAEATRIVLDISDLVRTDSTNEVRIRSHVPKTLYSVNGIKDRKPALVVGEFRIAVEDVPTRLKRVDGKEVRATVAPPSETHFELERSSAALKVLVRDTSVAVRSLFSIPGGGVVEMGGKDTLDTSFYSLKRKVVVRTNRIDVFDTFLSKTNELIGVKVRYEIPQNGFDPVYVAGDPSPSAEEFEGGRNPSVLGVCGEKGFSVALLAQDDVFRVQNVQYCKEGAFGIRTDGLALKPGEPRTVEWSIYPMGGGQGAARPTVDYFDFVNAVRRDWDVNFPIDGVFTFSLNNYASYNKERAIRNKQYESIRMQTMPVHYWVHIRDPKYWKYKDSVWGMGLNSPLVRVRMSATESVEIDPKPLNDFQSLCVARCREFTPDTKVFTYLHDQICAAADDAKYESCRMIDAKGRRMFYTTMRDGGTSKIFVPTSDNLYGRDFRKLVDWNFDHFGLDGIYLDEVNHCNSRLYYGTNMWDGATVELDDKGNVKRKLSYVCLLKLDFTLGLFDHILNKRAKLLVGNFSPETRSERRFHFPRFEETYSHRWIALSHLYTPIQLGDMLTYSNTPEDMAADQRIALKRGALYYHYVGNTGCPSLTSKMYPFTPIELHGGWLVGKERILTAVSGDFGWRGEKPEVDVFVFDELGREVKDYPYSVKDTEQGRIFTLELKADHCAAIVRR